MLLYTFVLHIVSAGAGQKKQPCISKMSSFLEKCGTIKCFPKVYQNVPKES